MRKHLIVVPAAMLGIVGAGLLVHQKLATPGGWFCWEQFWHHETLAVLCFVSAISLLVGRYGRS